MARFDGTRFVVDTGREGSGLPSTRLNGLTRASGDTLWVVTEGGEVARSVAGRYATAGTVPTDGPIALGVDRDGRLHSHFLSRLSPSAGRAERPVAGSFARDAQGDLWVRCDGDRLCHVRNGRLRAVGAGGVRHVIQGARRAVVLRQRGGQWLAADPEGRAIGSFAVQGRPLLLDRHARLWSLDGTAVAVAAAGSTVERVPLPAASVVATLEDREGVIWIATSTSGLVSVREAPFQVVSAREGLPPGPVTTVFDVGGALMVSAGGRLFDVRAGRAVPVATPPGSWHHAAQDAAGTLWLAGDQVIGLGADGSRRALDVMASQVVPDGERLWVRAATQTLALDVGGGRMEIVRRIPTEPSHSLTIGPEGEVWVGTNGGLVRIRPDVVETITTGDGLPTNIVRAVHPTDDGALWIGTYGGGLARLKNGRIDVLDEAWGLAENIVSSLFEDEAGVLWMGGNRSIHRVRRAAAEAVFAGRAQEAGGVAYGRDDGLLNPEGSGWPALQASDGRLWFPTFEGVAVVDPARALALEMAVPIVHAEGVHTETRAITGRQIRLGPDERRFTVRFTAASLRTPDRVRYQYRLDGFDDGWIGPTADREATFTNVPPGDYVFRVRARTDDGAWSDEATLAVSVVPRMWETAWFRLLVGLALVLGVVWVVRQRGERLRARADALDATVAERTAQLEAEKETVAAQAAELQTLDEAKSRLFANVSHEFRTPLQLILGPLADVIDGRHGDVSPEARDQLGLATRNGHRLLALVEQLLALARSDAGELEIDPVRLDAAAFAERLAEAFGPLAESNGIRFETDLPAATGTFDPVTVETALTNLLANAFSFTPAGGTVRLRLVPGETSLAFEVRDTGPGLAPEQAARVFDRFYQADTSSTRRQPGTGIGLALVREIADLHGGAATVESVPGHGATFTLRLPTNAEAPAATVPHELRTAALLAASGDGAAGDGRRRATPLPPVAPDDAPRVLVVDDNADLRALVRQHLDDRYIVVEAADGHEALDRARERVPDAIVSDVMMAGLDGLEMVQALRADPETDFAPILLLTARAAVSDTVAGLGAGADDYLAKPFAPAELRARVDALIAGRQRLRERWQGTPEPLPSLARPGATAEQRQLVEHLVAVIDQRIDDVELRVEALAEAAGASRATLYRRLDGAIDGTPADLIWEVRLTRAADLLRDGAGTVTEVAYAVGFRSVSHFGVRFQGRFGVSPSTFLEAASRS